MIIENLFPKPIGRINIKEKLNNKDVKYLTELEQRQNVSNTSSTDKYILNQKRLFKLKESIEENLNDFFTKIINPKNDVRLKITQSWVNWTKPGQYHHRHSHQNSFFSGCLYLAADEDKDKIVFFRNIYQPLNFPTKEWNLYNSESWWIPTGTGDLIFFPSNLAHMVQPVEGNKTRISVAFNSFPTGYIGDENDLNALYL